MAERATTPPPIAARLLGPAELRVGDRLLTDVDWPRRSPRHLLILLLVSPGHSLPRDRIVDLLWPEAAPTTTTNLVAIAVHRLRRALEPDLASGRASAFVEIAAGAIRLHLPPGSTVDVDVFEAALRAARALPTADRRQPLRDALAAYAGDLVADEPYLDWLVPRREQLAYLRHGAVVDLATLDLAAGEPLAAEPALLDLLRDDPSLEGAHQALIRAYAAAGQRERAEHRLRACRAALAEHLGVDPSPDTVAALDQAPLALPAPTRPASRLPTPPTRLIGRARELEQIADALLGGQHRLVTLVGPGGIGKTHLALEAAHALEGDVADGVVWVPLATLRDPALVPAALARALGVSDDGTRPIVEAIVDAIADRSILIVVDNLEQVLDGAPLLATLLAAAPGAVVLATSRQRLNLRGEHVLEVSPLPIRTDAVALFTARAAAAGVRLPGDQDLAFVHEICDRLDGIPLAIELAAGAARHLPLAQLVVRLGQRLDLLVDGPRDADPRQRTMRAAIAWSDALLTPAQQALFRRLGVFTGGAPRDLIDHVVRTPTDAHASLNAITDLDADLTVLTESHLLRREDSDAGPRYLLLETVRAYALERLANEGELAAIAGAHVGAFVALASQAIVEMPGPSRFAWLDRLAHDHDNLRAAVAWAVEQGDPTDALRIARCAVSFFVLRGHAREWRDRIDHALAMAEEADPLLVAGAHFAAGYLTEALRDFADARRRYGAGVALLAASPISPASDDIRFWLSSGLGDIAVMQAQLVVARTHYDEARRLATALDAPRLIRSIELNFGRLAMVEGNLEEASQCFASALLTTDDPHDRLMLTWNLVNIALEREDYAAVRELAAEALTLAREGEDLASIAVLNVWLGNAAVGLGEAGGGPFFAEAITRSVALDDPLIEAAARQGQAGEFRRVADFAGAAATVERAILLAYQLSDPQVGIEIVEELVPSLVHLGRPEMAARLVGAIDRARAEHDLPRLHRGLRLFDVHLADLAAAMPTAPREVAMAEGAQLSYAAMLDEALVACQDLLSR